MKHSTPEVDDHREHVIAPLFAQKAAPESTSASRAEGQAAVVAQIDAWHAHAVDRIGNDLERIVAGQSVDLLAAGDTYGLKVPADVQIARLAEDARAYQTFLIGKDAMLKRFKPLLDNLPEGLDPAARAVRLTELDAQIVRAEVVEERLIREAEAEGVIVDPRRGQRAEAAILIGYGGAE